MGNQKDTNTHTHTQLCTYMGKNRESPKLSPLAYLETLCKQKNEAKELPSALGNVECIFKVCLQSTLKNMMSLIDSKCLMKSLFHHFMMSKLTNHSLQWPHAVKNTDCLHRFKDWVAYQQQKFISHSSEGCKDQGTSSFGVVRVCFLIHIWRHLAVSSNGRRGR